MDAWRNGGTFEGKKATDDMVLAYWKERGKDLDKGDPEYEQSHNQVMQLEYAVAQSKADVLHVQGKMSDTAYAQFFLKWAQKVPANSEFYRTLQKDAAQLIESAKNKARINGERAKTEAFNAFVKTTTAKDIAIGDAMTAALTDLSKQTGLSVTGNGDELLALLTQQVKASPDQYRKLLDTIKAGDPHFGGVLTEGYFTQHLKAATEGYSLIADRAQKAGYVSAYASATQGMASMSQWGSNVKVWPVATTYSSLENAFQKVWNDPNASQMDKQSAANAFSAQLGKLANTPGIDVGSKTMIEADAQRLLGQDAGDNPSFGTSMLGRPGVDPKMTMQLGLWAQTAAEMNANPAAWAYAPVDEHGQFDATGQGPLGIVPAGSVQPGANGVMVPGADGKAVLAMVMPHTVYAVDPNNPNSSPSVVGHTISYNVGGKNITLWGYKDANNNPHWSLTSPLGDGVSTSVDNKGNVFVTPRAVDIATQVGSLTGGTLTDEQKKSLLAGGSIETVTDTSGKKLAGVKTTTTISVRDGYIVKTEKTDQIDATGALTSSTTTPTSLTQLPPENTTFSLSRLAAGDISGITFSSPLQASVQAASYTQTQDQVSRFSSDPAFQQAFLSQTMQTLGTSNPLDPRIADAWKSVTTAAAVPDQYTGLPAAQRSDLKYPGDTPNKDANQGQLSINFGSAGELRLPGLPSYLGQQNANLSGLGNAAGGLLNGLGTLMPGLGIPSQTPAGSPAPTVTPTAPTATPTAVTTGPGSTSLAPTPVPVPTTPPPPTGTGGGNSGGKKAV